MGRLRHKRGRKSNYLKSLNNDNHREAREKCLFRDDFKCRFPGCNEKIRLEFHHIDYKVLRNEMEGSNLQWCVMLCEDHHTAVHKNLQDPWNPKNFKKVNFKNR